MKCDNQWCLLKEFSLSLCPSRIQSSGVSMRRDAINTAVLLNDHQFLNLLLHTFFRRPGTWCYMMFKFLCPSVVRVAKWSGKSAHGLRDAKPGAEYHYNYGQVGKLINIKVRGGHLQTNPYWPMVSSPLKKIKVGWHWNCYSQYSWKPKNVPNHQLIMIDQYVSLNPLKETHHNINKPIRRIVSTRYPRINQDVLLGRPVSSGSPVLSDHASVPLPRPISQTFEINRINTSTNRKIK